MPYRLPAAVVVLVLVGAARGWFSGTLEARATVLVFTSVNVAVVAGTHQFINALLGVVVRVLPGWALRWALAKVYHQGGLPVGAAVSGTVAHLVVVALLLSVTIRSDGTGAPAVVAVSCAVVAMLVAMVVTRPCGRT